MSGKVVAGRLWSMAPRPDVFRFSPRPNQAHSIHWRPWGESAFQEAIRMDKPVFLVISSSWCQWCHIMDETTLSEPTIITILNRDYIPVRVDSDLRPDVNLRYNQNGWPSVVILSPEGEILWGGVYVPPQQMLYYLGHVRRYYSEHRQEIAEQVRSLQDSRYQRLTCPLAGESPARQQWSSCAEKEKVLNLLERLPAEAGNVLRELYDAENGGFLIHPHLKFPHPEALELLLMLANQGQPDMLEMVCYSLQQMHDGGLWDHEGGGFFRYSAASDWSTPHTEKMLEENVALLRVLVLAAQATQDQRWYEQAKQLLFYLNTALWQADAGIFSGSQSADEEYYEPGPYSRMSRQAPCVDTAVYTCWNARAISAYLLAAQVLQQPALSTMALRALEYLCTHMWHPDGGVCHYRMNGYAALPGQLADQVWLMRALLDAYDMQANGRYLDLAIDLMHYLCRELQDCSNGLFYDYSLDAASIGRLLWREQPLVENAIAAECLLRMAAYSGQQELRDAGLRVLSGCLEKYRRTGIRGVIYAAVVARAFEKGWLSNASRPLNGTA
ncbi:MAG: thioredoxin domain-containing protein [Ktedonobacteraceae bacterium]|nr:thioredoxin domain-containing protein [Ktedonobacteraceae bacterium]